MVRLALAATLAGGLALPAAAQTAMPEDATPETTADAPDAAPGAGGAEGADEGETPADAPPIVISEVEAQACAARLEPMAASFPEPMESIYLRRLAHGAYQVWAPRDLGPNAPLRPWCNTTLTAIAGVPYLSVETRAMMMDLVASAGDGPPPPPDAEAPVEAPPPPVVVEGEDDAEAPKGLPAAFQRMPPRGGRSAAVLGLPLPLMPGLYQASGGEVAACTEAGGQPSVRVDRLSGAILDSVCLLPDGALTPLPTVAAEVATMPGLSR
ncbi:hypothetical protein [Roseospira navarrensis]|uniref:Uncharacterized protein n=1 Tax=Roseospira navarrensis TaxID=140058 RepID=A0A7X2D3Z8_9PROT|nr:hypothetical protein [Roseospira navarrensis]MQX36127.1 hypothetical protein [Roseospira navarrensis]